MMGARDTILEGGASLDRVLVWEGPRVAEISTVDMSKLQELIDTVGEDSVVTSPARIDSYRWDRANDPEAGNPVAVVRANNAEDVQATIRFAAAHGIPVVPRGAGSGLSGGSSAVEGGIILSMEK